MSDWENLRHFVVLAREGTLSGAARQLGVDHATVARRVAALEAETGLKLVDRRARSYQLTGDGQRIAATAGPMEEALTETTLSDCFGIELRFERVDGRLFVRAPSRR